MFARARVQWPDVLKRIFRILSAFNFNLELAAPECAIPDVTYTTKWFGAMLLPITAAIIFSILYFAKYLHNLIKGVPASQRHAHAHRLVSVCVIMMYVLYLFLTRMTLDVFNCSPTDPPDGQLYMSGMTDIVCFESPVHLLLFPFALITMSGYVVALPLLALWWLRKNKLIVKHDQICRALASKDDRYRTRRFLTDEVWFFRQRWQRLYYLFRPGKW